MGTGRDGQNGDYCDQPDGHPLRVSSVACPIPNMDKKSIQLERLQDLGHTRRKVEDPTLKSSSQKVGDESSPTKEGNGLTCSSLWPDCCNPDGHISEVNLEDGRKGSAQIEPTLPILEIQEERIRELVMAQYEELGRKIREDLKREREEEEAAELKLRKRLLEEKRKK